MTEDSVYERLAQDALRDIAPDAASCLRILQDPAVELLPLLNAAYRVRREYFGRDVQIHIINNAQNGHCPEDCHYCAQAKTSEAAIADYPMKSDDEILEEARLAYEGGAFRYCMVFAGRGPSPRRVERLAGLIQRIKSAYPIQVCVSPGLLDREAAARLKEAGLDRLNHNLNTSERHYPEICTTHTFQDRVNTLQAAAAVGLEMCSGIIVGMGETGADVVDVATQLRDFKVKSIPVNFLVPIEGNQLREGGGLTPEYCLRVLCLFRFLNPRAEVRAAAGREFHLRGLEVLALYPANSLFLDGYLNTRGASRARTLRMIRDAGFTIRSEQKLDELISDEGELPAAASAVNGGDGAASIIKSLRELRPARAGAST